MHEHACRWISEPDFEMLLPTSLPHKLQVRTVQEILHLQTCSIDTLGSHFPCQVRALLTTKGNSVHRNVGVTHTHRVQEMCRNMRQNRACIQTLALLLDLIYNSIIDGTGHTLSCTVPHAHFQYQVISADARQAPCCSTHLLCSYIAAATVLQDRVGQNVHVGGPRRWQPRPKLPSRHVWQPVSGCTAAKLLSRITNHTACNATQSSQSLVLTVMMQPLSVLDGVPATCKHSSSIAV